MSNYKVVRTMYAGAFFGIVTKREGSEVIMTNVRQLCYWSGAASLCQVAMEGVKNPEQCRFPCEVDNVLLLGVVEILDCTDAAEKNLRAVPVWEATIKGGEQ